MLHFYEGQVRKFLTQFIRILSNFSVETGKTSAGSIGLRAVPVVYGDPTRQVANISNTHTNMHQISIVGNFLYFSHLGSAAIYVIGQPQP